MRSNVRAKKFYPQKPPDIPLTKETLTEAKVKIEELSSYRAEVLVRLQTAREMGDLSENGAYTAARFELNDTDRKIRHFEKLIRFGVVPAKNTGGTIGFGNTVTLKTKNQEVTYTLVSSYESDPTKQKLSVDSPLGQALVGKSPGQTVSISTPTGEKTYLISSLH